MLNRETVALNGFRTTTPVADGYNPIGFGPQTVAIPAPPPTIPPMFGASGGATGSNQVPEHVGGYGTAGNNNMVAGAASANPWSFKLSPLPWAVIGLVVSLFLIAKIHWRRTVLEGKENLDVAGAREEGAAAA